MIFTQFGNTFTYDHRTLRTELPVRSAVLKQGTGGLVVRWVTTSESPLLYVFANFLHLVSSQSNYLFCSLAILRFSCRIDQL